MTGNAVIYLDYAATTPVDPVVAERMSACLTMDGIFANPASRSHTPGWQAEQVVEQARGELAGLLHCDPREIIWTSGATESNNLALKGVAGACVAQHGRPGHLVTSVLEHKAVLEVADWLETSGWQVTRLQPDEAGQISVSAVMAALRDDTALVSLMWVNNETGAINPIRELAASLAGTGVLLHVDAAQALGKVAVDWTAPGPDLMSLSAHKAYGPKGCGALLRRRSTAPALQRQVHGGDQEQSLRAGTLATHQVAGFGRAARLLGERFEQDQAHVLACRDAFVEALGADERIQVNGPALRVPHILNLYFPGLDAETLMAALPQLACSSGSACNSADLSPSHVLLGLGCSPQRALQSLRVSFGRFLAVGQAAAAGELLGRAYARLVPA